MPGEDILTCPEKIYCVFPPCINRLRPAMTTRHSGAHRFVWGMQRCGGHLVGDARGAAGYLDEVYAAGGQGDCGVGLASGGYQAAVGTVDRYFGSVGVADGEAAALKLQAVGGRLGGTGF